jgi:hypothetical protein
VDRGGSFGLSETREEKRASTSARYSGRQARTADARVKVIKNKVMSSESDRIDSLAKEAQLLLQNINKNASLSLTLT